MNKRLFLFSVLLSLLALPMVSSAYDFSAVAPSGQTLYYNINSSTTTVTLTYPGNSSGYNYYGYTKPTGNLSIPSNVTYNGTTYPVTSIGSDAFRGCSGLTSVTIPNSVTSIVQNAFSNCTGLTSITIGNSVTSISHSAFYGCSGLTSVTIGNSVTSIGYEAFALCSSLTSVTIGNSVTSIGDYAFGGCTGLDTLFMLAQLPPTITVNTFQSVPTNIPIYVPCGSTADYNNAAYWNVFTRVQENDNCGNVVSLEVNNSSMGTVYGDGLYPLGSTVEIMAVPQAGHYFQQWNDNNTSNPRTIVVTSDTSFTAIFAAIPEPVDIHTLSVVSANASQGLAAGNGEFPEGTVVEIAAIPIEGHHFVSWHDGNTDNPRQVTLTENKYYIASFGTVSTDAVIPYNFHVYAVHDVIVVENADGNRVRIFDAVGRQMAAQPSVTDTYRYQVPASGVYLIQVGDYPARKVTIVK